MTNSLALTLGAIILGAVVIDLMLFGTDHMVFLGKKMFELLHYIAFWR